MVRHTLRQHVDADAQRREPLSGLSFVGFLNAAWCYAFFEALPFVCFGLLGGVLADTFNRKKMMISTQILNLIPGIILAILTGSGHIRVWHINVLSLITSSLQVLGGPARQAIVPSLIPPGLLLNAVTLTTIMQQGTQLTGPVLAGYLIDFVGLDKAYSLATAASLVPSIVWCS